MKLGTLGRQFNLVLFVALIAAMLVLPSLLQPVSTCVVGDAHLLRSGVVPDALRVVQLDAQRMRLGMGSAAIGGWNNLGDALVVAGQVWLRPTNRDAANFYGLAHGRYFWSSSFTYVPINRKRRVIRRPAYPMTLAENWRRLSRDFPDGVIASGYVRFQELGLIAIAAPAIDGKSIGSNAAYYYTQPMETASDVWAFIIGLTLSNSHMRYKISLDRERLNSPAGPDKLARTHALRLKYSPSDFSMPPRSDNVLAVGEVVDSSVVVDGELELFPITRVAECRDGFSATGG